MPGRRESPPDDWADQTRERAREWLKRIMSDAAHWSATEGIRLSKEGAKSAAHHLEEAAKNFRKGNREGGVAHLKKAAQEANGKDSNRIENAAKVIESGPKPEAEPDVFKMMRGEA